jgi:polar amino acid transport system substrate-binding protein
MTTSEQSTPGNSTARALSDSKRGYKTASAGSSRVVSVRVRRYSAFYLVCLSAILLFVLRLGLASRQDASLQRVKEAGVLVVGFDASYPPFETTDGLGDFSGFDVDLGQLIAQRLGVRVEVANIAFDTLYDALTANRADVVISGLRYEAERTRDVIYTVPYFDAGQVLVVRAADGFARPGDLAGRKIGVETASEAAIELTKLARKTAGMQVAQFETPEKSVAALRNHEVDAVAADHVSARELVKEQTDLRLLLPPFAADPLVIAGNIKDRSLMTEINRILRKLQEEGALDRLALRWF